jgi:hypothetical protein
MPQLPFLALQCLACGRPAEPGFHFCAGHLRLTWADDAPWVVPVARESEDLPPAPVPVQVIECHPSDAPLMSAAGYRLAFTRFDPDTFQPELQVWVKDGDGC